MCRDCMTKCVSASIPCIQGMYKLNVTGFPSIRGIWNATVCHTPPAAAEPLEDSASALTLGV